MSRKQVLVEPISLAPQDNHFTELQVAPVGLLAQEAAAVGAEALATTTAPRSGPAEPAVRALLVVVVLRAELALDMAPEAAEAEQRRPLEVRPQVAATEKQVTS
jgi:hypothetical protein